MAGAERGEPGAVPLRRSCMVGLEHLDALAAALRSAAATADEQGRAVGALAGALDWTGDAGDAFRAGMARRVAACATAADDLTAAARACERHAAAVRTVLHWLDGSW